MKKIIYLAMVAVISAFALSCDKGVGDDELYTWSYTFEVVKTGGLSEADLVQLNAAFDISESQLQFVATLDDAEQAFNASFSRLENAFKEDISMLEHTSEVQIKISCSSSVKTFSKIVKIP